jgi:hypothetical protein
MESKSLHYDLVKSSLNQLASINTRGFMAFKTAWIATTCVDNALPNLRIVVVRSFIEPNILEIHTDTRSQKWLQLKEQPFTELGFYDPKLKLQLRARANVQLFEGTAESRQKFAGLSTNQRNNYTTIDAPGSLLTEELAFSDTAYFGIVKAQISHLDCLQLLSDNQSIRAQASWNPVSHSFDVEALVP